jgi:hypothetical protein
MQIEKGMLDEAHAATTFYPRVEATIEELHHILCDKELKIKEEATMHPKLEFDLSLCKMIPLMKVRLPFLIDIEKLQLAFFNGIKKGFP